MDALGKFFRRRRRRRPPGFGKLQLLEFYYGIGASGVRGSIRLVFRVPTASGVRKVVVGKIQISNIRRKKTKKKRQKQA